MKSAQPTLVWDWKWWLQAQNPANISVMMNYSLLWVPPHHMQRTAFKEQVTIFFGFKPYIPNHCIYTMQCHKCTIGINQKYLSLQDHPSNKNHRDNLISGSTPAAASRVTHSQCWLWWPGRPNGHHWGLLHGPEPGCTLGSPCRWKHRNNCIQKPEAAKEYEANAKILGNEEQPERSSLLHLRGPCPKLGVAPLLVPWVRCQPGWLQRVAARQCSQRTPRGLTPLPANCVTEPAGFTEESSVWLKNSCLWGGMAATFAK